MQRCHGHDSSLVMWARPDRFSETNAIDLAWRSHTLRPLSRGDGESRHSHTATPLVHRTYAHMSTVRTGRRCWSTGWSSASLCWGCGWG